MATKTKAPARRPRASTPPEHDRFADLASAHHTAAQAMMPFLEAEAKERLHEGQGRGRDSRWSPANSQETIENGTTMSGNPGRAAAHAAKLSGVSSRLIYEAKQLDEVAKTDAHAAALVEQVRQGELSIYRASQLAGVARPSRTEEGRKHRHDHQKGDTTTDATSMPVNPVASATPAPRSLADITREVEEEVEAARRRTRSPLKALGEDGHAHC